MVLIYAFTQQAKLLQISLYKIFRSHSTCICSISYGLHDMGLLKSKHKDVQMYMDKLAADMNVLQCRSKNVAQQNEHI